VDHRVAQPDTLSFQPCEHVAENFSHARGVFGMLGVANSESNAKTVGDNSNYPQRWPNQSGKILSATQLCTGKCELALVHSILDNGNVSQAPQS
jgi:hypothetical protein